MSVTPDSVLHKTLHDRFHTTRSAGERAVLALALQALMEAQLRRQETLARVREVSAHIQRTEAQIARLHAHVFQMAGGAPDRCSISDIRILECLSGILAGHETRLRATKEELNSAEIRLANIVVAWATGKF
ncbi:hypothetical protein IWQ56_002290 [Coemansia nantahalensis]|uniref:Uncharacterized protein n=2 Tax=Coemansia TaxID=4863 RepID=A0ACC1LF07_9FUNG|nr:hypothetical protein IWQ56_002290 [Coemansia nantahalensis]KAJ2775679.1 hypothetical protein IWQ57_000249 [Coemansia nantahalensis]KAJ2807142.1 hypothetical protein H4R21_000597 [Coemansia helicoidea]